VPARYSRSPLRKTRSAALPKTSHTYRWWLWTGPPTFEGVCDALAAQYAVLDELIQPLLAGGLDQVPRLDRRRVAVRLAHLTAVAEEVVAATRQGPEAVAVAVPAPAPAPVAGLDAVDWYRQRSAEGVDPAGAVARIDAGRAIRTGVAALAARHRAATAVAIAVLRSGTPDLAVGGSGAGLALAEFAATRLAAAVVHGLDLAEALGRPGRADPAATNLVSGFLAAVAERGATGPASAPIAVDGEGSLITLTAGQHKARIPAVDWIQAATGRRPADRLLPGTHAWLTAELPLVA